MSGNGVDSVSWKASTDFPGQKGNAQASHDSSVGDLSRGRSFA